MKITRFARGYRMRLTEGEMAALAIVVARGSAFDQRTITQVCSGHGRRVSVPLRKLMEGHGLRVDEDRRPVLKRAAGNSGRPLPASTKETADV